MVNGKTVTVDAQFLDFADLGACVSYLVTRWYKDWDQYAGVNRVATREAAAHELVKQGYATDPDYAEKLIRVMEQQPLSAQAQDKTASGVAPVSKPVLFSIQATQDTLLKKQPKQSTELGDKEKQVVSAGKVYAVCAYTESAADAHAQVELGSNAGAWWIYEPHWAKQQQSGKAVLSSVDWTDFGCLVTPNLTVGEILQWDKRRIPGPNTSVRTRLLATAAVFQEVRDAWGQPLKITSFYRPEPINGEVGGVPGSKHTTGEAMDVYPTTRSLESFYQWIRRRWTGGLGDGRNKGFVHLDRRGGGGFVPGAGVRPAAEWLY